MKLPYDKAADIYSLSLVLHEMFGGHGHDNYFPSPDLLLRDISVYYAKARRDSLRLKELPISPKTLK